MGGITEQSTAAREDTRAKSSRVDLLVHGVVCVGLGTTYLCEREAGQIIVKSFDTKCGSSYKSLH